MGLGWWWWGEGGELVEQRVRVVVEVGTRKMYSLKEDVPGKKQQKQKQVHRNKTKQKTLRRFDRYVFMRMCFT